MVKVSANGELCSGTLLGQENGNYWVLTSAHCLGNKGSTGVGTASGSWTGQLLDFTLYPIGQQGTYFLPQERAGQSDLPSWGTDICLLQIKKDSEPNDRDGHKLVPAVLYSGNAEVGKQTQTGGHGSWGVGSSNEGGWQPPSNANAFRRAHGDGYVETTSSNGALQIPYSPEDGTGNRTWAQVGPGDSGGPTYANINGKNVLIGVNQSYSADHSLVTRVSYYLNSFIKKHYGGVQTSG